MCSRPTSRTPRESWLPRATTPGVCDNPACPSEALLVYMGRERAVGGARSLEHQDMSIPRALAAWMLLLVLAVGNGTLRQVGYAAELGDATAHRISTVILL